MIETYLSFVRLYDKLGDLKVQFVHTTLIQEMVYT